MSYGEAQQVENTPQVSMDAFSMYYSHMMDNSADHPAFKLQDGQQMNSFLPTSNDLFTKKVNANLMVVVSGVQAPQDILAETTLFVSDDESKDYVSLAQSAFKDTDSAIMIASEQTEIRQDTEATEEAFGRFDNDFSNLDVNIFDKTKEADQQFIIQVEKAKTLALSSSSMKLIEITALETLGKAYGFESKQYKEANLVMRDLFEKFIIPNFPTDGFSTFILTPATKNQVRRDVPVLAQGVCFKTLNDCNNGTDQCSGHGQCAQVQENCFSCQCKSSQFVGDSCQYINSVADFQLLFWTTVLLIVITASVVVCVYQSGDMVDGGIIMAQSLPKQD
ncbi:hypothetical protein BDF21DRAFT_421828 [Thamnidium elegans]|nr:hypothetical protein BDF21DRAFT_421828 [Thamnidium elegans]